MSDTTTPTPSRPSQPTPSSQTSPTGAPTQLSGAAPLHGPLLPTQPLSGAANPQPIPWFSAGIQDRLRTGALPTLLQPNYSADPTPSGPSGPFSQRISQDGGGSRRGWWGFSDGDDVNIPEPRQQDATAATAAARAPATQSAAPAVSLGSQETVPGDATRASREEAESTAERGSAGGGGGGVAPPGGVLNSQELSQTNKGQDDGLHEPMDTREAGERSKVARTLQFGDAPGRAARQQQQHLVPAPQAHQTGLVHRSATSITPEQARRAEANRQAALVKRRQRLEAQAVNLFAAYPSGTPPPQEKTSRIYEELNKVLTAQRRAPAPPPTSSGQSSQPAPSSQSRPSPQGPPLTPEQRERMERSRQAALRRQAERAAAEAAAIMARAEREGQRVRQEQANAAARGSRGASQHQQQRRPTDQTWRKFA